MLNFFRHTYRLKIIQFFFILFFLTISPNIKAADKSLSFDGTDDFIEIPNDGALNPTGAYTVAAWWKQEGQTTGKNSWQSIITSRSTTGTGAKGYMMYLRREDLKNSNDDIRDFIKKTIPTSPAKY